MTDSVASAPAVDALYRDHHRWLQTWLHRKLGCSQQAADLAQDAFVRILSREVDPPSLREPRAYLSTIARGLMYNFWRHQALERAYAEALAAQPEALEPSPEERVLVIEAIQEIDRVLGGLSSLEREAFLLSQLDGLTYPQIAARLQVTVNRVQKAMIKAVRHCYRALYD